MFKNCKIIGKTLWVQRKRSSNGNNKLLSANQSFLVQKSTQSSWSNNYNHSIITISNPPDWLLHFNCFWLEQMIPFINYIAFIFHFYNHFLDWLIKIRIPTKKFCTTKIYFLLVDLFTYPIHLRFKLKSPYLLPKELYWSLHHWSEW